MTNFGLSLLVGKVLHKRGMGRGAPRYPFGVQDRKNAKFHERYILHGELKGFKNRDFHCFLDFGLVF